MSKIMRYSMELVLCSVLWSQTTASATPIENTVYYNNVIESSGTDSTPLYYTPTVSGDTLNFNPIFTAFADGSDGNASDTTDGQLGFDVCATGANVINELQFSERGDYSLLSFGQAALADVSAAFFIEVLEVDGAALASPVNDEAEMTFSSNVNGQFKLNSFGTSCGLWTGNVNFDMNALLTTSGVSFVNGATKIHVELDNTLQVLAQTDSEAFIAKKDFQVFSVTSNPNSIPEPATLSLVAVLSGTVLFIRRLFIA